jgi:hypothetical protein
MLRPLILSLLLVSSAPALAADAKGNFAVKGYGQANCADLVRASSSRNMAELTPFLQWLAGYLSAANQYERDTYDLLSWQTDQVIAASLIDYCRANPKVSVALAAGKMVQSLRASRVRSAAGYQILTINGQRIRFADETMLRMKQILAAQAGYRGAMDRRFGPDAQDALRRFQTSRRLRATGMPDEPTLVALFAGAGR